MVEVTFEHQGAASVQLNGRAFVPQVQLNTRVTRGSEGQYARLAAIIKASSTGVLRFGTAVPGQPHACMYGGPGHDIDCVGDGGGGAGGVR